jgi:hypothetical protein
MPLLVDRGMTKSFGRVKALVDVDFAVDALAPDDAPVIPSALSGTIEHDPA